MIKTQHCPNCETQAAEIEQLRHDLERQMTIANEHVDELATFKQEVSDALQKFSARGTWDNWDSLVRFIIPKPDPLVEVLDEMKDGRAGPTTESYAACLRAALEARGLEVREKNT